MIVVSDTSSLTALITVRRSDILPALFGEVCVPEAVRDELLRGHASLPEFIRVVAVQDQQLRKQLSRKLDPGEAEAIVLARELEADLLLMDEKAGRREATVWGVRVIGLMAVLVLAKHRGLIASVQTMAQTLREEAGFRVANDILLAVFRASGEA